VIAKINNNNKIKMNLKPLSSHILIEPLEEEKVSKGGIVLPDTVEKEKPVKGKIIATGPGKINENGEVVKMSVKVGDIVLFKKYGPDEFEIEGKKYLIGDEDDVLATIE
jgi:chaperonin GroES